MNGGTFNGLGMGLHNVSRLSAAKTRSISAENFMGEKGKAGMATEGTGARAAQDLGQGASEIGTSSAVVTWSTSLPSSGTVEYGTPPSYGTTVSDPLQAAAHRVVLTGLRPNRLYYYRVRARGAGQTVAASGTFITQNVIVPLPAPLPYIIRD